MEPNRDEGEHLTPQEAVAEIRRIEGLHGALRRHASGLTWMIWGIVAPAIFMSYAVLGSLVTTNHSLRWLFPFLWIPWAGLGVVASMALWNSVGLVVPVRPAQVREGIITGAIIIVLILAGFGVVASGKIAIIGDAWVLTAQGMGLIAAGLLGLNINDASERRLWLIGGGLLIATGLAGSHLVGSAAWFNVITPVTSASVLFGGGLYLTRKVD